MRYRQHKSDGTQIEAYWLTDFPARKTSSRTLYTCAKARWEIENQGFNEGNNHHGFEHIPHHHANSLFIHWLLIFLALCIERLFRLKHLHRGTHRPPTPIHLLLLSRHLPFATAASVPALSISLFTGCSVNPSLHS